MYMREPWNYYGIVTPIAQLRHPSRLSFFVICFLVEEPPSLSLLIVIV